MNLLQETYPNQGNNEHINFSNNTVKTIPLILTMLVILVYQINTSDPVKIVFGCLFVLLLCAMDAKSSFYLIMFIMVGNEYLNIGGTSLIIIYLFLFACKSLLLRKAKTVVYVPLAICTVLLISMCLLEAIVSSTGQIINALKCLLYLYYISFVLEETKFSRKSLYINAFTFLALGINYAGCISVLLNGLPSLSARYAFTKEITINFQAIICALTIVNLIYFWSVLKDSHKLRSIILVAGCCFWGLLTQSRSFILTILIGILMLFLTSRSIKNKFKVLLAIAMAALLLVLLYSFNQAAHTLLSEIIARIISPRNDDISNGRYDLWQQTINKMYENTSYLLFGAGDYTIIDASFNNTILAAHNMFIETWCIFGYVGSALIVFLFFFFIRTYVFGKEKIGRIPFSSFTPIVVMISALFFSHHFIGRSMSMVFILSILPMTHQMIHTKIEVKKIA